MMKRLAGKKRQINITTTTTKKMDRKANLESNGYLAEMNQFHLSAEVERCGWQMS